MRWTAPIYMAAAITPALCCSRVAYNSGVTDGDRIVVGRSMDWYVPTNSSLWLFPAGMKRNGRAGNNSLNWTTKYGSVIASLYDVASVDGINSQGLVANALYLSEADYGPRDYSLPAISVSLWQQYFLDNFASVSEVEKGILNVDGTPKFQVRGVDILPGVASTVHISLADPSGDNMILEYLSGSLVIHHSRNYTVLTNSPPFQQQLAINEYWAPIANVSLPGTDRAADRFARLSYYNTIVPNSTDAVTAIGTTAGMVRAVSVPMMPTTIDTPDLSKTLWRVYSDTHDLRYVYEDATRPTILWVELSQLDLSTGGEVKVLALNGTWEAMEGDLTWQFQPATPFLPLEADN